MHLYLQLSKLQGTTSYLDGNMGRVGVKSDTVGLYSTFVGDLSQSDFFSKIKPPLATVFKFSHCNLKYWY